MLKQKRRILNIFVISTVTLVLLVIAFVSPITKYLIEKYDEKYTGRQIKIDWAYVNPFTGYLHFSNLKIYELNSDSIFISAKGLSANIAMIKLFSKTYEISELILDHPRGLILQNKKYFNFNDLIQKFSPKKNSQKTKGPVHFNLLDITINNGEFYYRELVTPINYCIKNVNIESAGLRWNVDTIPIKFSFLSGMGRGDMNGNFVLNSKNKDYRLAVAVNKFDLNIIEQYLKKLANYGTFSAILDADFKSYGNLIKRENVTNSGLISISNFHFGKNPKEDFVAFDNLTLSIKELSPQKHKYLFDSVFLNRPYFKYERYDYLDNVQTVFGKKGANIKSVSKDPSKFNLVIEIANYLKLMSKNLFKSDYKVAKLAIKNGDIRFNDYSLSEKFSIALNPFSLIADSIDKQNERVKAIFESGIKPYGNIAVNLSVNPKDSSDFDLNYRFQKLSAAMFNPYLINYTSFPLDRGAIELNGNWHVRNGNISSNNHLLIIDPRTASRLKNKDTKWIPLRLIMFFIRERGNVIDYEVPITGNLNKPDFHFKDVIFDALQNIFVKPINTPYRTEVKNVETEVEKSMALKWKMNSTALSNNQESFIEKMVAFLKDNSKASINIHPHNFTLKEKEYITLFEAKKLYFMKNNNKSAQSLNENDSIEINKMSIKDSSFIRYLDSKINNNLIFTVQEKCAMLVGLNTINKLFKKLTKEREKIVTQYFTNNGLEKRITLLKEKTVIPFNGFSYLKIDYNGNLPDYIIKAYKKMNALNNKAPREKFKNERLKNKHVE